VLSQAERDRLIEEHVDFARRVAVGVFRDLGEPSTVDIEDLIAYGLRGLTEAAQRYDATRGVTFNTFAYYRIRGGVYDGLRQTGWLSRGMARAVADAGMNEFLSNQADRSVGADAGRQTTTQAVEDLANTLDDLATVFLTAMDGEGGPEYADEAAPAADERLEQQQTETSVRRALQTLPERERKLLELHYYGGLSLTDAGAKLGASRSWASRLHSKAIQSLTRALGPSLLADTG
jgi:RNA polymerase sigma factor for flagellar operon FliA